MPLNLQPLFPGLTNPQSQTGIGIFTCDAQGNPQAGVVVWFRMVEPPPLQNCSFPDEPFSMTSNASGAVQLVLLKNAVYEVWREGGAMHRFTASDQAATNLPSI